MDNISLYLQDADVFYREAFQRNIGLLSQEEQEKLRRSKVAIAGAGGVGGFHLINLVRLGIGRFSIADSECYEIANIQRQRGAYIDTLGKNKSEVIKSIALSINPHLEIKSFPGGISSSNIGDFLYDVDILIDGIDFFCIEEKRLIFKEARKRRVYAITAGPLGFGSALLIFSPSGMSFDDYLDIDDKMSYSEKIIAFGLGLAPAGIHLKYFNLDSVDLNAKKGPSLVSACNLCSVLAATEVINILLKRREPKVAPYYFQFDPYMKSYKRGYLLCGNRNPIQKFKRWYILRKLSSQTNPFNR